MRKLLLLLCFVLSSFQVVIAQLELKFNSATVLPGSTGGQTFYSYVYDSKVDANSNLYVTGTFSGPVDFNPGAATNTLVGDSTFGDIFLAKYDSSGNYLWAFKIEGDGTGMSYALALDNSGYVYIGGKFNSVIDFDPSSSIFNLTAIGTEDAFVAKYSSSGSFIYASGFGGSGSRAAIKHMACDNTGNLFVAGDNRFAAIDLDPSASTLMTYSGVAYHDLMFFAKYGPTGSILFGKSFTTTGFMDGITPGGVALDAAGNLVIAGTYTGTIDFDPDSAPYDVAGGYSPNIFIAKYNGTSGYMMFAKAIDGYGQKYVNGLVIDGGGNICITGSFEQSADFDPDYGSLMLNSYPDGGLYIAKYTSAGILVFAKNIGGMSTRPGGLAVDASNNWYVAGGSPSNGTDDMDPGEGTTYITGSGFITKFSSTGSLIYARPITAPTYNISPQKLLITPSGKLVISGYFYNAMLFEPSGTYYQGNYGTNMFFAKYREVNVIKPTLSFIANSPYNNNGVFPAVGQAGMYTYSVIYKHTSNVAPKPGYPKVSIDKNGDGDFIDGGEGVYTMTKSGNTSNWSAGEVYTYARSLTVGNQYGYKFSAYDADDNQAVVTDVGYKSGPVVSVQTLDLSIFANDITFSDPNPDPGEQFTVYANIRNNTPYTANNINIRFYTDSVYYNQTTLLSIAANSNATVSMNFVYDADGFYPIKVWIDSIGALGENNKLNNYAIRPVTVGHFSVPGAINVTAGATPMTCPYGAMFYGNATYSGLNLVGNPPVLGATVTVNYVSATGATGSVTTHTITDGNWSVYAGGLNCATIYSYTVTITDYTLEGTSSSQNFIIPCVTCDGGGGPGSSGGGSTPPCLISGQAFNYSFSVTNNGTATAYNNVIGLYVDSVLVQTYNVDSISAGQTVSYIKSITLTEGTHILYYTHEYYDASNVQYNSQSSNVTYVSPALTDLYLSDFMLPTDTAFRVKNVNSTCITAPASYMYIFDAANVGGPYSLVDSVPSPSVAVGSYALLNYSFVKWSQGIHYIRLKTDGQQVISETNEVNNFLAAVLNVRPDIRVTQITPTKRSVQAGDTMRFLATLVNTGVKADAFNVGFMINDVSVGSVDIDSLGAGATRVIASPVYTVASDGCPKMVKVMADATEVITELREANNTDSLNFGYDFNAGAYCNNVGSSCNHYVVELGNQLHMESIVRNIGTRNAGQVNVRFSLAGVQLGTDNISSLNAGGFGIVQLNHIFSATGTFTVEVKADYDNNYCEINEDNNIGYIYVDVVTGLPDLRIYSEHISPSNLNPNPGQTITVVASIQNAGEVISEPCLVRFKVDGVQLGADVAINAIYPGQDTTVAATVPYSSNIVGPKIIEVRVDSAHVQVESDTTNNAATRAVIFGAAPDIASAINQKITFNPASYTVGQSVQLSVYLRNYGGEAGSGLVKFYSRIGGMKVLITTLPVTLNHHDSVKKTINWVVPAASGMIITEVVSVVPQEFNILNNTDSVAFTASAAVKQNQTITFNAIADKCRSSADFLPGATASSALAVSYSSNNLSVATIVSGKIHLTGIGTVTITATQAGNSSYNAAAPVSRTFSVLSRLPQTITFAAIGPKTFGDADFTVSASSSAGLPISYSSSNTAIATVNATTGLVHLRTAGSVVIKATQAGNTCVAPASWSRPLTITQASAVINFPPIAVKKYGDPAFSPGATSTSPYPIKYRSSNSNIARFTNSGLISIRCPGTVTITAYQDAGSSYDAPDSVSQVLNIIKGDQTVSFDPLPDKVVGTTFRLQATAPGGRIVFTSSNPLVAEVMPGNNLKLKRIGVVTITARQTDSRYYNPASTARVLNIVPGTGKPQPLAPEEIPIVLADQGSVFPNPANDVANVQFTCGVAGKVKMLIYDAIGNLVLQEESNTSKGVNLVVLNVAMLRAGNYFIHLVADDKVHKISFIKL